MINHERYVRAVLRVLREENLIVDPNKANMFMGVGPLWAHSEGGETESRTRKTAVNPEVGVARNGNCTSGFLGS